MSSSNPASNSAPAPLPPPSSIVPTVTPAALSSLVIYNPSLGPTDESVHDQIVFYTSHRGSAVTTNDRLRQIGLAQGVVEFARGFSKTQNLSSVETERSRIITLEVEEPGWWILAQIDLTVIHNPTTFPPTVKYSAQEVSPPALLLADIRRAYDQFHFHHGSFASNFARLGRSAFCKRLEKYWLRWAWGRWEVMLHSSPAVAIYGGSGVKMAGGRPGKEMGSEEREFLKGWAEKEKSRGLVELVASRFGEPFSEAKNAKGGENQGFWFWNNSTKSLISAFSALPKGQKGPAVVMPQDGCIFAGTGTLDSSSIRDVATYLSELYQYGDDFSSRKGMTARRRRHHSRPKGPTRSTIGGSNSPSRRSSSATKPAGEDMEPAARPTGPTLAPAAEEDGDRGGGAEEVPARATQEPPDKKGSSSNTNTKILNLLTFGWGGGALSARVGQVKPTDSAASSPGPSSRAPSPAPMKVINPRPVEQTDGSAGKSTGDEGSAKKPRFVIGFLGDLEVEDLEESESGGIITSRTIWAARKSAPASETEQSRADATVGEDGGRRDSRNLEEFRIVVYTNHPFVLGFIFESSSPHLTAPSFYRTLHHQLAPLHEPMLKFSPLGQRTAKHLLLQCPGLPSSILKPPYDLLYNPDTKEIHCTLPPIPEPVPESPNAGAIWTRADAFHAHSLILRMLSETTDDQSERERSARSTKGWWVNWMRLDSGEEGFIIRRAGEKKGADVAAGLVPSGGTGSGAGGIDIRNYFEGFIRGTK